MSFLSISPISISLSLKPNQDYYNRIFKFQVRFCILYRSSKRLKLKVPRDLYYIGYYNNYMDYLVR